MTREHQSWNRLTDLARRTPSGAAAIEMPAGLSTRVVAAWMLQRREGFVESPWETFAVRALALACLITVAAAVAAWPVVTSGTRDSITDVADPISMEVLPL